MPHQFPCWRPAVTVKWLHVSMFARADHDCTLPALIGWLGFAFASSLATTDGVRFKRMAVLELSKGFARTKLLRFNVKGVRSGCIS